MFERNEIVFKNKEVKSQSVLILLTIPFICFVNRALSWNLMFGTLSHQCFHLLKQQVKWRVTGSGIKSLPLSYFFAFFNPSRSGSRSMQIHSQHHCDGAGVLQQACLAGYGASSVCLTYWSPKPASQREPLPGAECRFAWLSLAVMQRILNVYVRNEWPQYFSGIASFVEI